MGSDKEDLARWADLVLDGKPINIDQTIRQQAATIADLREAVRVLANELARVPELVSEAVSANPIAAEAVRKAGG